MRIVAPAILAMLVLPLASFASAAEWANLAFENRHHNFGTVARAAKTEHIFEFTNSFDKPIHVSSVRASCGCTTPIIMTETVQPGEKGQIKARFNTRSFLGQKGATLTVVFDQPRYGEAQLRVDGYVRRDVVCDPGELDLGTVKAGEKIEKTINIQYAGRSDWAITSASSSIPGLELKVEESKRQGGRIGYELTATYIADSSGYVNGEIELATNDRNRTKVPLAVSGKIVEAISASPSPLMFGTLEVAATANKKLILRGDDPFKIVEIKCADERLSWELSDEAKKLHIIPVKFVANEEAGPVNCRLEILTDCGSAKCVEIQVEAEIK